MTHYYLTFFTRLRLPISVSRRSGWLLKTLFEVADRDCEARPLPNQLCGGTKKVLRTFFARALKSKSEVEIKLLELLISVSRHSGWLTALEPFGSSSSLINCVGAGLRNQTLRVTDFCLSTQGLIDDTWTFRFFVQSNQLCGGTKKVLWTFFARALNPKSEEEIKLFKLLISVSWRSGWWLKTLFWGIR